MFTNNWGGCSQLRTQRNPDKKFPARTSSRSFAEPVGVEHGVSSFSQKLVDAATGLPQEHFLAADSPESTANLSLAAFLASPAFIWFTTIPGQKKIPIATFRPDIPVLSSISRRILLISAVWVAISVQFNLSSADCRTLTCVSTTKNR